MGRGAYLKGARWERSLKTELEARGFYVMRAASSGTDGTSPDLIALRSTKKFALECKAWRGSVYIEAQKMRIMRAWENITGLPVFIAWKHARDPWRFYPLAALRETPNGHTLTESDLGGGLTFEEMVK
jgi:Holliday junction resolvase